MEERKLAPEIALDPASMHLRTAEARSWMKIKAGPDTEAVSRSAGRFLSNQRGARGPAWAPHPASDCISGTLPAPHGSYQRSSPADLLTRTLFFGVPCEGNLVPQLGGLYYPPKALCREQAVLRHKPAERGDTPGYLPEQECNCLMVETQLGISPHSWGGSPQTHTKT